MKKQFIRYLFFFLVLPFSISIFFASQPLEVSLESKVYDSLLDALRLTSIRIENVLEAMRSAATSITLNESVYTYLREPDQYNELEKLKAIRGAITVVSNSYLDAIDNEITLIGNSGCLYTNWTYTKDDYARLSDSYLVNRVREANGGFIWHYGVTDHSYSSNHSVVTVARQIDNFNYAAPVGVCMISTYESNLRKIYNDINRYAGSTLALIDADGITISASDPNYVGTNLLQSFDPGMPEGERGYFSAFIYDETHIVSYSDIRHTGWRLVQIIPYNRLFAQTRQLRFLNRGLQIGILLLFSLLSIVITDRITRPLVALRNKMSRFYTSSDAVSPRMTLFKRQNEIGDLESAYQQMTDRIDLLLVDIRKEQKVKEEMSMRVLRSQINVHFMFNTLNNIKLTAYMDGNARVGDMIAAFSDLLGEGLQHQAETTLGADLNHVSNYLRLRLIFCEADISMAVDVPSQLLCAQIPVHILQPIVENSLNHGFKMCQRSGIIRLSARTIQDDILICIEDNGVGMDPAALDALMARLHNGIIEMGEMHMGLKNIQDRITIYLPGAYGIRVESTPGKGMLVSICIPFQVQSPPESAKVEDTRRSSSDGKDSGVSR